VHRAIAEVKVQEIDALEKINAELKARIDEYIAITKEAEEKSAAAVVALNDAKVADDIEKLKLERKLAATQALIDDTEQREQKMASKCEKLAEHLAKQEAAVARKEIEMLREQAKKR